MTPILSILIPTVTGRERFYDSLMESLRPQLNDTIELITEKDSKEMTIGDKRNLLVSRATGLFSSFIDDDDQIAPYYVHYITSAIQHNPGIDVIGIKGMFIKDGRGQKPFIHSIECSDYTQDNFAYYRPPNHINPIRTDIMKQFKFPSVSMGEDTDWAMQIQRSGALKKEHFIDQILYRYQYVSRKFY